MAANRERRSNAGNRLRALLNQEEEMEELFDDEGVDEEFEIEGKQEDIVDSDFDQSSADEEPEDDEEANLGEDPEEAKARKKQQAMLNHLKTGKSSMSIPGSSIGEIGGRVKSSRPAAATGTLSAFKKKTTPAPRRTSSSVATSAAASPASAMEPAIRIPAEVRKSSRRTTVLNNQETELKLLEYETRKAMMPKREKVVVHKMTQEELLEEAKKTEELNLASLQAFKAMEMEKKKVVKKKEVVMENFVRYHSFAEWIGHGPLIQDLADTGAATPGGTRPSSRPGSRNASRPGSRNGSRPGSRSGSVAPEVTPTQYGQHGGGVPPQSLAQSLAQSLLQQQKPRSISNSRDSSPNRSQLRVEFSGADSPSGGGYRTPGSPMSIDMGGQDVEMGSPMESGAITPVQFATMNMSAGSIARKRKRLHPSQMCGRNWVTFMGYDEQDAPLNEWSYVENYPERKPVCPITGLPAKYKDPKSGIPYANKEAYKILQNVIRHGYVWSPGLNAYCHDVAQPLPKGVPAGMAEALVGGQQVGGGIVLKDGDLVSAGVSGGGGGGGGYTYRKRQSYAQE